MFVEATHSTSSSPGPFDAVVLSFVLHNLDVGRRRALLGRIKSLLDPGGRIALMEWSLPAVPIRAVLWQCVLARIEPSPSVRETWPERLPGDAASGGLTVRHEQRWAGGRVQPLICEPTDPGSAERATSRGAP